MPMFCLLAIHNVASLTRHCGGKRNGYFILRADNKMYRLVKLAKAAISDYVSAKYNLTVAKVSKHVNQYVACIVASLFTTLIHLLHLNRIFSCDCIHLFILCLLYRRVSAINVAMKHSKMSPYESCALDDWREKKTNRFDALRMAVKKTTPLAAWQEVSYVSFIILL